MPTDGKAARALSVAMQWNAEGSGEAASEESEVLMAAHRTQCPVGCASAAASTMPDTMHSWWQTPHLMSEAEREPLNEQTMRLAAREDWT